MKKLTALVLALMLALCACGTAQTAEPLAGASDGMVTYTVHVQDESGAPLAGVMVQLCKDLCIPGVTDEEGNAVFTAAEEDYKVALMSLPAGFAYSTEETEFTFPDGSRALTITLKAA